jgi:hypothetical protein
MEMNCLDVTPSRAFGVSFSQGTIKQASYCIEVMPKKGINKQPVPLLFSKQEASFITQ